MHQLTSCASHVIFKHIMKFINLITISIYITYFKTHKPHIFYLLFATWTETKRFSSKGPSIYIMNTKKKRQEKIASNTTTHYMIKPNLLCSSKVNCSCEICSNTITELLTRDLLAFCDERYIHSTGSSH
jgi:hypothetical protein